MAKKDPKAAQPTEAPAMPDADSREWWKLQAERLKDEVDDVTLKARAADTAHAEALAQAKAEYASAVGQVKEMLAKSEQDREAALSAHGVTSQTLALHQQALGDVLGTMGPSLARIAQLITK